MRALMTLEGSRFSRTGFSFFETAKPYAKEFMLRREGRIFGKLVLDKLTGREMAIADSVVAVGSSKMAAQMYFERSQLRFRSDF